MSGFLYYFPGCQAPIASGKHEQIPIECELNHLKGATWTYGKVENFRLDWSKGSIIAVHAAYKSGGKEALAGYFPQNQTWIPCYSGEKLTHYLGYENTNPPTPEDLIKEK